MLKGKNKNALIIPLLAVLSGFIVGAVLMLVFGYNPIQNYVNLFAGAFGDVYSVSETLRNMTPLLLTGLGFAVSSKAGFFNIGGPGQYLMGWFGAVVFALHFHALPGIVLIIGSILCGALCGAIWSGIAGVLRAFFGTSEVISTIMLNYIALYYVNHAIKTWLAPKGSDSSPNIPKKASLCTDFLQNLTHGSTFHWGFFLAILCAFAVWFYFNKTCSGFEVRSVGMNPSASRYAGMNVKKTIIVAMIISGILAGLAGALDGIGNYQNISVSNSTPIVGFDGMAVALLAGENPIGMLFSALLFSALQIGGLSISVLSTTPSEIVNVVMASIIFFVGIKYAFEMLIKKGVIKKGAKAKEADNQ